MKNHFFYLTRPIAISLILLINLSIDLSAQLQENLEFLDHSDIETILLDYKIIGDKIIYIDQNSRSEETRVKIMNTNKKTGSVINFSIPVQSEVKIISESDSVFSVYLYQLHADTRDFYSGGIYKVNYSFGKISVDTINIYLGARGMHESVLIDTAGFLLASSGAHIQYIANKKVVKEIEDLNGSGHLYQNDKGDIFMISKWRNLIHYFNGDNLVNEIKIDSDILDFKLVNSKNLLLFESELRIYNDDFTEVLSALKLPKDIKSFKQILFKDSTIYLLNNAKNKYQILSLDHKGNLEMLLEHDDQSIRMNMISYLNDTSFLLAGQYRGAILNDNLFFRNVSLNKHLKYNRVNVELHNYELRFSHFDSVSSRHPGYYIYDTKFSFTNNSDIPIEHTTMYSSRYLDLNNSHSLDMQLSRKIFPDQEIQIDTIDKIPRWHPDPFSVLIVGADNKFNISPFRLVKAKLFTSINAQLNYNSIVLYPNPVHDKFIIETNQELVAIGIYNDLGQLMYYCNNPSTKSTNVSSLMPGSYIVKIDGSKNTQTIKFIKQ